MSDPALGCQNRGSRSEVGQGEMRDSGGVCREEWIAYRPLSGIVDIYFMRLSPSYVYFRKQ